MPQAHVNQYERAFRAWQLLTATAGGTRSWAACTGRRVRIMWRRGSSGRPGPSSGSQVRPAGVGVRQC
jgi:hypothetical protein